MAKTISVTKEEEWLLKRILREVHGGIEEMLAHNLLAKLARAKVG